MSMEPLAAQAAVILKHLVTNTGSRSGAVGTVVITSMGEIEDRSDGGTRRSRRAQLPSGRRAGPSAPWAEVTDLALFLSAEQRGFESRGQNMETIIGITHFKL